MLHNLILCNRAATPGAGQAVLAGGHLRASMERGEEGRAGRWSARYLTAARQHGGAGTGLRRRQSQILGVEVVDRRSEAGGPQRGTCKGYPKGT